MNRISPKLLFTARRRLLRQLASAGIVAGSTSFQSFAQTKRPDNVAADGLYSPHLFGAKGDGQTKDTEALQKTIDSCAAAGGGVVTLEPNHVYVSGTLVLRPGVQFHLAGGSVLRASPSRDDFRALGALLFAKDADDLHVSGTGVIDGNFQAFFPPKGPQGYPVPQPFLGPYDPLLDASSLNPPDGRPRMILLVNCRRVLLEQFIIRDSPTWTIHPVGCEDLRISGLSILNNLDVPNCDGIDIDHCRRVHIEGCTIVAGDDCLVLKASRNFGQYGPCEGLTITNCTLESSSAAIKVEPEGPYPVRSAVVSNCSIVRSNRGISILNRDGATVEDLLFTDIVIDTKMRSAMWWGSGEPVAVSSLPRHTGGPAGLLRNVGFANLLCRGESGIYLRGSNEAPLQDITFTRVSIAVEKTTPIQGGFYDMRPGDTFGESGLDHRSTAGFFAEQANGLSLNGIQVHWPGEKPAYYGSALELHHCHGTSLVQVTGQAAHPGNPAAVLDDVTMISEIPTRP